MSCSAKVVWTNFPVSPNDVFRWGIVDITRLDGFDIEIVVKSLRGWLYNAALSKVDIVGLDDLPLPIFRFPEWRHAGNHIETAIRFWHFFHHGFAGGTLELGDKPDLRGNFGPRSNFTPFYGEIGKASFMCFLESWTTLTKGGVWISVQDGGSTIYHLESGMDLEEERRGIFEDWLDVRK